MNTQQATKEAVEIVREHLRDGLEYCEVYESERAIDEDWSQEDMKRIYDATFKITDELAARL